MVAEVPSVVVILIVVLDAAAAEVAARMSLVLAALVKLLGVVSFGSTSWCSDFGASVGGYDS